MNIGQSVDSINDDSIEVVTLLKVPADLPVNNKTGKTKPRIVSTSFSMKTGKLNMNLACQDKSVLIFLRMNALPKKHTAPIAYSTASVANARQFTK